MLLSLNWIKQFVDLPEIDAHELGSLVTLRTAEVEGVENEAETYKNMYVARVASLEKHPGADKLNLCTIDVGSEGARQIVCGGQNLSEGMLIAYADKGAKVKWHGEGDPIELGYAKVRGIESQGMICAGEEIGMDADNVEGQKEVRIKDLSHLEAEPGTPLAEALGKNDLVFEIDNKSLTHRPDLWGHYGFAREFAAIMDKELKPLDLEFDFPDGPSPLKVDVQEPELCPRFSACIITGLKVEESPQWMKTLLQAAGVRPVNNIVDVTNYVMLEIGQPMHAYDRQKFKTDHIVVRYAKDGELFTAIDHKERKLIESDPLVTNGESPEDLAGIMGGLGSEISDETTEIILESANWNPTIVRKSSTYHGLRSDASQRYEKSQDPTNTEYAVIRACQLLKKLCPEMKVEGGMVDVVNWEKPEIEVKLDPKYVKSVIGADVDGKEMISSLEKLGFEVSHDEILTVKVPSWRATKDVSITEDLIEEIARMHGYENIPTFLPPLPIKPPRTFIERTEKHRARQILAMGLNMNEVIRYSFYSEEDVQNCMLDEAKHLRVDNYLSEDQTHLRTTLVPNMLKAVHLNLKYREVVRVFEFGRTYLEDGYMPVEEKHLCGMIADSRKKKNAGPLEQSFYDAKGILEAFFERMGAKGYKFQKTENPPSYAHPKKCVEVLYRGKSIGHLFSIHPLVAKHYDIDADTAAFEINFTQMITSGLNPTMYTPLSKLPSLTFDISVIMDERAEIADIEKIIKNCGGKLTKKIELFDLYQGKNIEDGKKALAFRITLHSEERTLTDNDMAEVQKKIFEQLQKIGGEIRGL